jgi:RNA polymerase sigma-70 factor (ECF subfamily)
MVNVTPHVLHDTSDLVALVRDHLDEMVSYATHLVGDPDDAVEFVAGGLQHASRFPPAQLSSGGRPWLYRAVTRACRQQLRYPPRPHGPARLFRRTRPPVHVEIDATAAERMNTVKRALMTVPFDRRAALLLRDLAGLSYRDVGVALETSPEAAARLLAGARRQFGAVYREIAL